MNLRQVPKPRKGYQWDGKKKLVMASPRRMYRATLGEFFRTVLFWLVAIFYGIPHIIKRHRREKEWFE